MLYALLCFDKAGAQDVRLATRAAHLEFIAAHEERVKFAGPFLSEDEQSSVGSMIVIEAPSKADAEAWAALDPYARAGLFERVEIQAWRWLINAPDDQ